jgi:ACS family glucarate transporter-like MFS transporter
VIRYRVVAFAVLLAAITYLDRVCISILAPSIQNDLGLNKKEMSYIFSAFTLAYAAFEIPTAWWADRSGTRLVLARIVTWWSCFTIATSAAFNFWSLWAIRFLFGAGEAGAWPCVARTFARWIPARERGRIQGIFFAGAHAAGGLTPMLVTLLLPLLPWRAVFACFGTLGFFWAFAWYRWFRNEPSEHPQVQPAELRLIEEGRAATSSHHEGWDYWKRLLTHPNILPLCLMYVANVYSFYFCITWFPSYLAEARGFAAMKLGFFAGLPLMASVAGDILGGWVTDKATARFGLKFGRSGVGAIAYCIAGIAMTLGAIATDPLASAIWISFSVAASMFTLGASWSVCIDIGGTHSGVISAAMNTAGQIAGILSPIVLAAIVDASANWAIPLYIMSALFFAGAVCWLFIDPRNRVFD